MISESVRLMTDIEAPISPFPGLRPFEFDESHLFFGRDGQSEQLLRKLSSTRFVAVVGTSGSGKSSLVRAGLLPDLFGGFISSAGSHWRVAIMRPSNDPLGNLASALAAESVFGSETKENAQLQATIIEATLRRGSLGLVEVVRQHRMPANENLLVIVDQFEELFRFARVMSDDTYNYEAASFVKLLLEAARQRELAIYVVLTMRSDFLGDCSLFWELPEAINEGQYLIPRLTRDQRRQAITGPVAVCGGEMTERLVNRLLNDMGDDPDQLPILQHALMRTWNKWKEEGGQGALDLAHYEAIGGMAEALSRHADEAYEELKDERQREIAEKIFKGLTEKGADNKEIRRPIVLQELCALADAGAEEVKAVIEVFRREGRTFLMPPAPVALAEDSLIDISHESLIRNWQRLKAWVDEEALSGQIYRRLAETAALYEKDEAGLWRDPDLQIALNWREETRPNKVWAKRYHTGFDAAMNFLDASVAARDAERLESERRRQRELRRARLTAIIFAIAFLFALAVLAYAINQRNIAQEQSAFARKALDDAQKAREDALKQKEIAVIEAQNAAFQAERAEEASEKATAEKDNAEKQQKIAEEQRSEAEHAKSQAQQQARIAEENRTRAELAKKDAEEQRNLAVAEGEKNSQLLYAADLNLAQQSYEANNIRRGQSLLIDHRPVTLSYSPQEVRQSKSLAGFEFYYLWRLYNGELEMIVDKSEGAVNSVAFSPDGRLIASGSSNGTIILWNRNSNGERTSTEIEAIKEDEVKTIAFSPNGKMIALAGGKGEVKLLFPASPLSSSAAVALKLPENLSTASVASISNIAFSPDGKMLALGISAGAKNSKSMSHRALVWNAETRQLIADLEGHASFINSVVFARDGSCFATASSDGTVKVWDARPGSIKYRYQLTGEDNPALSLALSHDGKVLAVGYQNGAVRLWPFSYYLNVADVRVASNDRKNELTTAKEKKGAVSSLSFKPDDKILALGREDGTIELWFKSQASDSFQELTTFKSNQLGITSLAFSPDGSVLTSGSKGFVMRLWDTGPQLFKRLPLRTASAVSTMARSADGRMIAIGTIDATVKLCDSDSDRNCRTFSRPAGAVKAMALSPDGKILAIAGQSSNVELWRTGAMDEGAAVVLSGHEDIVNAVAFSPDGRLIATGSRDGNAVLWDVASRSEKKRLRIVGSVRSLAFSPDGNLLAIGSSTGDVTLWTINLDSEPIMLYERMGIADSVAFSPDGKTLAASQGDRVSLWDVASLSAATARSEISDSNAVGKSVRLEGQAGIVNAVAFSPDGKTLATGGENGAIKLWSVKSYKELITLTGHKRSVTSLLFAPDGHWLASGSYDNTVRFWYAATVDEYLAQRDRP